MRILVAAMLLTLIAPNTIMAERRGINSMELLNVTSPAFRHGDPIPARYTCDGQDVSPPIVISKVPASSRGLALIVDDPDAPAGTWVHWVVWNIPVQTREIPENALPLGSIQGMNGWKRNSYGGPCPPSGTHRYYFRLYALDTELHLAPSTSKADLEGAMRGHILAKAELMGTYRRR